MINDLIADLLTRIRNATLVRHSRTYVLYNKKIILLLNFFFQEGLIKSYKLVSFKNYKKIEINLRYTGRWILKPLYSNLLKISKPGQQSYIQKDKYNKYIFISKYINSLFLIATSSGIMTHLQAYRSRKGGEIICCIHKE